MVRLSDNINIALVPSDSPFLFDFAGITGESDFEAPEIPEATEIVPVPDTTENESSDSDN